MNTKCTRAGSIALAAGSLLFAACATGPSVDQARGANPASCSRFAWQRQGDQPASLSDQRIRDATLANLQAKGYAFTEGNADCEVSYVLGVSERPRSRSSIGFGVGGGSGGFGGGVGVTLPIGKKLHAATLRISVGDSARHSTIWTASLDTEVADTVTQEQATVLVDKLLAKYPQRAAAR